MKVVAVIQARMGSTRLPGKVLRNISGKPMLWHMLDRIKSSKRIDDIVLAIPDSRQNDELEQFVKKLGLKCFRGSEEDVLSRYYEAAIKFAADVVVRLTSDCPLIDPRITDRVIDEHLLTDRDINYTSTGMKRTFPRGLDAEVFGFAALKRAYEEARLDYEREHVTPYIYLHPEIFKLKSVEATGKQKRPDLRLTVDTEEDLKLIREIFTRLYRDDQIFYAEDVIDLLDIYPNLVAINAGIRQKELGE